MPNTRIAKGFVVKRKKLEEKNTESKKKSNKPLAEFYPQEQHAKEEIRSIEEQIFEHLKNHTKKSLRKISKKD